MKKTTTPYARLRRLLTFARVVRDDYAVCLFFSKTVGCKDVPAEKEAREFQQLLSQIMEGGNDE